MSVSHEKETYFSLRGVSDFETEDTTLPAYLVATLPVDKQIAICDLGCGYGRLLLGLRQAGFSNTHGVDLDEAGIAWGQAQGLTITHSSIADFVDQVSAVRYDMVMMSHVLEHLPKDSIIPTLQKIKANLLKEGGSLFIMVPNAQSATGCYWAYEDFTHSTLFTTGSLGYVLRAAGFNTIEFIDPLCVAGLSKPRAWLRKVLLACYKGRQAFWNKVTGSSFHKASPQIYSFEIKVKAS